MKKLLALFFAVVLCVPGYGSDILVYKLTCSINPKIDFTDANQTTTEKPSAVKVSGYVVLNAKNADVSDANVWQAGLGEDGNSLSGSEVFDDNQTLIMFGGKGADKWYEYYTNDSGDSDNFIFDLHIFNTTSPASIGLLAYNAWAKKANWDSEIDFDNLYGVSKKGNDIGRIDKSKVELFKTLKGTYNSWDTDWKELGTVIWTLDSKYTKDANKNSRTQQGTVDKIIEALETQGYAYKYSLAINIVGSGTVARDPNRTEYRYGDVVQLTVAPADDWSFSSWSGDLSGSDNPKSITIDGKNTVTAIFTSENTLTGKIMCGYQGWFACPGDGSGRSWVHWANGSPFDYTNLKIEMWPDVSEYAEKYQATGFTLGSPPYYVFSSYDANTVMVHFKWMQEYGIDGVFVQRFGSDFGVKSFLNTVLSNVKVAANFYGRKYAVMYDFTNYNPSTIIDDIQEDWTELEDVYGISNDPDDDSYIKHNGKPVIAIYGIGWFGDYADMGKVATLIDWFKDRGFTVVIGVNNDWRTNSDADYRDCVSKADIIMPWNVGRYSSTSVASYCTTKWVPDMTYCNTNDKEYMVCVFPGFSWNNWNGGGYNKIPRNGGQFLWDQIYLAKNNGAEMIYVAMFDEVDESSAIFKVSNDPPPESGDIRFLTLDADGDPLPSDEYLWLVGQAARGFRGEITVTSTRPSR